MRRELRTVDPDKGGGGYVAFYDGTGTFTGAADEIFAALRDEIGDDELAEQLVDEGWSNGYIYLGPAMHGPTLPDEDNLPRAEGDAGDKRARTLALLGVTRAAGHDVTPGNDQLHHYWTRGEGLAKWIESDHQFYTLRDLLAEATDGKVPLEQLSRWAAAWVQRSLATGQAPTHTGSSTASRHAATA